jgi:hypothetical protein
VIVFTLALGIGINTMFFSSNAAIPIRICEVRRNLQCLSEIGQCSLRVTHCPFGQSAIVVSLRTPRIQ